MSKHKHLAQEERITIEHRLTQKESFKSIARELCKDPTAITKRSQDPYTAHEDES